MAPYWAADELVGNDWGFSKWSQLAVCEAETPAAFASTSCSIYQEATVTQFDRATANSHQQVSLPTPQELHKKAGYGLLAQNCSTVQPLTREF